MIHSTTKVRPGTRPAANIKMIHGMWSRALSARNPAVIR